LTKKVGVDDRLREIRARGRLSARGSILKVPELERELPVRKGSGEDVMSPRSKRLIQLKAKIPGIQAGKVDTGPTEDASPRSKRIIELKARAGGNRKSSESKFGI
jgi:hypothetical protein